jgi:hypothetical protein
MILSHKDLIVEKYSKINKVNSYSSKFNLMLDEGFFSYNPMTFKPEINFVCKATFDAERIFDSSIIEEDDSWYLRLIEEFQQLSFLEFKNKKNELITKVTKKLGDKMEPGFMSSKIAQEFFEHAENVGSKEFNEIFYYQDINEVDVGEINIDFNVEGALHGGLLGMHMPNNPIVTHKLLMHASSKGYDSYDSIDKKRFFNNLMGELMFGIYNNLKENDPELKRIGIVEVGITPIAILNGESSLVRGVMVRYIKNN